MCKRKLQIEGAEKGYQKTGSRIKFSALMNYYIGDIC